MKYEFFENSINSFKFFYLPHSTPSPTHTQKRISSGATIVAEEENTTYRRENFIDGVIITSA